MKFCKALPDQCHCHCQNLLQTVHPAGHCWQLLVPNNQLSWSNVWRRMESNLPGSLSCYPVNCKLNNIVVVHILIYISATSNMLCLVPNHKHCSQISTEKRAPLKDNARQFVPFVNVKIRQNMPNRHEGMKDRLLFSLVREIFLKNIHSYHIA